MASQPINEIVGNEAYEQLKKLRNELVSTNDEVIKLINSSFSFRKELEAATGYKKSEDGMRSLSSVTDQLRDATEKSKKSIEDINKAVADEGKKAAKSADMNRKLEQATKRLEQATTEEAKELAKLNVQLQQQAAKNKTAARETLAGANSLEAMRAKASRLAAELARADMGSKKFKELERELKNANKELSDAEKKYNSFGRNVGNYSGGIIKAFKQMSAGILSVGAAIGILKNASKAIGDFEQANADLGSILGKTKEEITKLTESAKQLGSTTEWMASQVTELQTELAKLGFTEAEIIEMQSSILQFSTALGADLGAAAEVAGVALKSFGLEAKDVSRVVSVMAQGANMSALDFEDFKVSMANVGPVAKSFGFTIEDTVALLGTLGNAGFDASSASTALRNIMLNLADSSGKLATELGKPARTLPEISKGLKELSERGIDVGEALELTDKRSVSAFLTIAAGTDTLESLRKEMHNTGGVLENIQKKRLDTLQGSVKLMNSAWEGLMLSFSNSNGIVRKAVDGLTGLLNRLNEVSTSGIKNKGIAIALASVWGLYGIAVNKARIAAVAGNTAAKITNSLMAVQKTVVLASSVAYNKLTGNTIRANAAQKMLKTTMAATPWGAVLAAVSAIGLGIHKLATRTTEAEKAMKGFNRESARTEAEVKFLFDALKKTEKGSEEYRKTLEKIKELYPELIADMVNEKGELYDIEGAYLRVNKAIREKIALQIKEKTNTDAIAQNLENQKQQLDDIRKRLEKQGFGANYIDSFLDEVLAGVNDNKTFDEIYTALSRKFSDADLIGSIFGGGIGTDITSMVRSQTAMNNTLKDTESAFSHILKNQELITDEQKIQALQKEMAAADTKEEKEAIREQIRLLREKNEAAAGADGGNTGGNHDKESMEESVKYFAELQKKKADLEADTDRKRLELSLSRLEEKRTAELALYGNTKEEQKRINDYYDNLKAKEASEYDKRRLDKIRKDTKTANDIMLQLDEQRLKNSEKTNKEIEQGLIDLEKKRLEKVLEENEKSMNEELEILKKNFENMEGDTELYLKEYDAIKKKWNAINEQAVQTSTDKEVKIRKEGLQKIIDDIQLKMNMLNALIDEAEAKGAITADDAAIAKAKNTAEAAKETEDVLKGLKETHRDCGMSAEEYDTKMAVSSANTAKTHKESTDLIMEDNKKLGQSYLELGQTILDVTFQLGNAIANGLDNEVRAVKIQQSIAMAQVLLEQGKALAMVVPKAIQDGNILTAAVKIAGAVATVMGAITQAKSAIEQAKSHVAQASAYADGTNYHKGGAAFIAEAGYPEMLVVGKKKMLIEKPTFFEDLPVGAAVHPMKHIEREYPDFSAFGNTHTDGMSKEDARAMIQRLDRLVGKETVKVDVGKNVYSYIEKGKARSKILNKQFKI